MRGAGIKGEADVAQIKREGVGAVFTKLGELRGEPVERLDFGLGLEGFDLDGALGLDDALVGGGLGRG